jgi:deoxyribonucleoside regulator
MMNEEPDAKEMNLMVRCVQLFYRHQRQQREIAQMLAISTSKVSRLLKRAYAEGIVRVDIDLRPLPSLGARLMGKFGLRDAVVIPCGEASEVKEDLGIAASSYFERIAGDGVKVGLSAGLTLYHAINHLRRGVVRNSTIYPLAAESTLKFVDLFPNTLVGMMAAKYRPDVTAYAMHAISGEGKGSPPALHVLFRKSPELGEIYNAANDVDVSLLGVGSITPNSPGFCVVAEHHGVSAEKLKELGAVAEVNYQPIDASGKQLVGREIDRLSTRILAVPVGRLCEMSKQHGKHVIAVAGGRPKADSIRAVLSGRIVNVLITDQEVAEILLDDEEGPAKNVSLP